MRVRDRGFFYIIFPESESVQIKYAVLSVSSKLTGASLVNGRLQRVGVTTVRIPSGQGFTLLLHVDHKIRAQTTCALAQG